MKQESGQSQLKRKIIDSLWCCKMLTETHHAPAVNRGAIK